MKKLFLPFIFMITVLPFLSKAQTKSDINIKTEWSGKQDFSTKQLQLKFYSIGNDGDYEYLNNGMYSENLFRYNLSTKETEMMELDLSNGDNERYPEFTIMLNETVYIFSSFQNKKQKKHYLFVQELDKGRFELNSAKKIAELSYDGESSRRPAIFNYALSPDKSKILIYYSVINKNNEILRSGCNVYDCKFNELQQYGNIRSGVSGLFAFGQYVVDNAGNVYVEGRAYADDKDLNKNPEWGKSYVILYTKESPEPKPIAIAFPENKYPVARRLGVNNKSELIYAGIFSQAGMKNGIGVFAAKINTETHIAEQTKLYNFDFKYLTRGMKESDQESMKKSIAKGNDFEKYYSGLQDIKFMDNGTFTLIGEKSYTVVYHDQKMGTSYSYYFGDIMVANFKEDASVNWIQKIPKDIVYSIPQLGPCGVIFGKDNSTKVFYNYDENNVLGIPIGKKANFIMINFDANGEESYKEMKGTRADSHYIFPSIIDPLKPDEILILGSRKVKPEFLKLTLGE